MHLSQTATQGIIGLSSNAKHITELLVNLAQLAIHWITGSSSIARTTRISIRRHFITQPIVSGVGLTLDERDAKTAQDNWDHWFHQLNGYMVMTLNKQETPLPTRAVIHQQLQMGNFDDRRDTGVCVNELAAKCYVLQQLSQFCLRR